MNDTYSYKVSDRELIAKLQEHVKTHSLPSNLRIRITQLLHTDFENIHKKTRKVRSNMNPKTMTRKKRKHDHNKTRKNKRKGGSADKKTRKKKYINNL
jgi:hypothetical protein